MSGQAPSLSEPLSPDPDVLAAIDGGSTGRRRRGWLLALIGAAVVIAVGVGLAGGGDSAWQTGTVTEDTLVREVTAVGQLEPVTTVEISSDLSGEIAEVLVDVNEQVAAGQPLARLAPLDFENNAESATAQWRSATASLEQAQVTEESARLALARLERLIDRGAATAVELEDAQQAVKTAKAQVAAARAQQQQSSVALSQAREDLGQTTITAPADGVVLQRLVEPGQTVVSAMSATPLFTVASDLSTLVAEVYVEEADVGVVAPGQLAAFTVPAWPDRTFSAEVVSIDLAPDDSASVVAYRTVLRVDNTDGALRPGMTATAEIEISRTDGLLHVPIEALRFQPDGALPAEGDQVYVLRGDDLEAVPVEVLGTSGVRAAVSSETLQPGDTIVVGEAS